MKTNMINTNSVIKSICAVVLLLGMSANAWGLTLQFDFTSNISEWPTATGSSEASKTYTLDGTAYTFLLGGNVYCNSGYLMLRSTTYLGLPAISGKILTDVSICNSSSCSPSTKVEVASSKSGTDVTGGAAQTFSKTSYAYDYSLSGTSANTMYYLYVTSANCQITKLMLTYENSSAYKVTYDAENGTCSKDDDTEASANAGVTLPTATSNVSGWEFAGWATATCDETTTAPRLYLAGETYYPDEAITLHAVYRKMTDGTSTSTATFTASTLSGLTNISKDPYVKYWWLHTSSGVEFYIKAYGLYSSNFNLDDSGGDGWALLDAHRRIKEVVFTARSSDEVLDDIAAYDDGSVSVNTDGTEQTVTCSGNVTQLMMVAPSGEESYISSIVVTYYDTKFNSNPCGNIVTLSKGTKSNVSSIEFSSDDVQTCSSTAANRQVTVTVTTNTGYKMDGDLGFSKTGTVTATKNSGPTGSGPYTYVYEFNQNDNGTATFSATATAKTYTINLNGNTGTGHTSSVTATYNSSTLSSSITPPSKTGHTFKGWYSGSGGTGTKIIDEDGVLQASVDGYTGAGGIWTKDASTTLYAKWDVNPYTLAVSAVDNVEISVTTPSVAEGASTSRNYGTTVTLSHGTPDEGHVWGGWNVYKTGDTNTTVSVDGNNQFTMPDYNVTVSANLYGDLKAWCEVEFGIYDQAGTGDADIHLTSAYNTTVYATSGSNNLITVIAENLDAIANLGGSTANKQNIQIRYLDANNGDAEVDKAQSPFRLCNDGTTNYNVADGSNINLNGKVDTVMTYSISYTPKDYNVTDHYKLQLKLQNNSTVAKTITLDLYGHSLPKEFVIAAKHADDGKWYALPNNLLSSSSQPSIVPVNITSFVDNTTTPTKVTNPMDTVVYGATDRYKNSPNTQFASIRFTVNGSNYLQAATGASDYNMWLPTGNAVAQNFYLKSSDFASYTVRLDPANSNSKIMGLYSTYFGLHTDAAKGHDIYFLPVEYSKVDEYMSEPSIMEWGTDHVVMELRNAGSAYYYKTQVGGGALSAKNQLSTMGKDAGVYRLPITLAAADASKELKIYFYTSSDVANGVFSFTIPMMISASDAATSTIDKATAAQCDLVVLNGGVLTVSENSSSAKKTFRDLYIYGGGKLVVPTGTYIDFSNVYMRGGHLNASWQYQYSNPQLVLNGTMGNALDTINYDYLTNNAQFYSLALPYPVKLKDIVNPYFNNKRSWEIHAYDGLSRSTGGTGWYDVEVGTGVEPNRIAPLGANDALSVGVGYTFWGAMQKVNGTRQQWSVNRFKMPLASGTAEAEKFGEEDGVTVKAYGMTYNADSAKYVYDENIRKNNAGWNMVGNPFLANINGSEDLEGDMEAIIIDHHEEKVLDPESGKWTGQMKWVENETGARYVRIPFDNGENYHQVRFKDTTLRAFHHFFIQVGVNGKFRLEKKYRAQSIVARLRANGAVLPAEMDIDFILRNGNDKTSFGLTVNDAFVTGFQAGEDMPDELGGVNMKGYTLANGERLSYNGLPSVAAEQLIPVGYRAQTAGTHTISYKTGRYDDYIEHIWLTDYVLGQTVDLLNGAYEFTTGAGVFDDRFALNVVFNRNQMPTGIDEVESFETDEAPVKFIYNDKMFIRYKGIIYDATGKKVGEVIRNK